MPASRRRWVQRTAVYCKQLFDVVGHLAYLVGVPVLGGPKGNPRPDRATRVIDIGPQLRAVGRLLEACEKCDSFKAGTDFCTGTTRPGTDRAGLSTNRRGRCRPRVSADCNRCDYTARRDRDGSAGCKPRGCVDHRCGQGIGDQLQDCAADRGGCQGVPTTPACGGQLTLPSPQLASGTSPLVDHRPHG